MDPAPGKGGRGGGKGGKGGRWQNKKKEVATESVVSKNQIQTEEVKKLLASTKFIFIDGCEGEGGGQVRS